MDPDAGYALIDCGEGRRLERFGDRVVDRPAPVAAWPRRQPGAWRDAELRYERHAGWAGRTAPWQVDVRGITLELRPTPAGQVGFFPEHAELWPSLDAVAAGRPGAPVLHLFAYTGPTTLALVRAGARVTHVDASRPAVEWARHNATLSGLTEAPIRWIVDDAAGFVRREARRGRRYAGVVLDPPSYGHAGRSPAWRIDADLAGLLHATADVLERGAFVLLTSHSVGWAPERLIEALEAALPFEPADGGALELPATSGAVLPLGSFARGIIRP